MLHGKFSLIDLAGEVSVPLNGSFANVVLAID